MNEHQKDIDLGDVMARATATLAEHQPHPGPEENLVDGVGKAITSPTAPPDRPRRFHYDAHSSGLGNELFAKVTALTVDIEQLDDKIEAMRVSAEGRIDYVCNERDTLIEAIHKSSEDKVTDIEIERDELIDQLQAERADKERSHRILNAAIESLSEVPT